MYSLMAIYGNTTRAFWDTTQKALYSCIIDVKEVLYKCCWHTPIRAENSGGCEAELS